MRNNKFLFLITVSYFILGMINIHFALVGFVCMTIPIVLLIKDKKKTWCQGYCPRACLYNHTGKITKEFSLKTPRFFIKGPMKWIMLSYFVLSLTIIIITTIKVANGRHPADFLKFLLIFPIKGMPQLFDITSPEWLLHLSYRLYSMMMTTTIIGFVLSLVYKSRTWCTICPIATVSSVYLKRSKNKANKHM